MGTDKNKATFFTFPVKLLENCFTNIELACNQMMNYSMYAHSLKLNEGTLLEKLKSSASYHNVTLGNSKSTLENSKALFDRLPEKLPMTSVNSSIVFQFRDEYKTEFEIACFVAFAAIRSMLWKREYLKINDSALLSRMAGLSSLNYTFYQIPEHLKKYMKRYHRDKLLNELAENWHITTYARHTRGYYVSSSMDYEILGFEVEKTRQNRKQNQLKKEANERILARLKPP